MVNFGLSGLVTWCTCQLEEGPPAPVEMRLLVGSAPFGCARDHTQGLALTRQLCHSALPPVQL